MKRVLLALLLLFPILASATHTCGVGINDGACHIAANGNDSWDGTSKTFVSGTTGPWLHAPGMTSATGNAASQVPVAGDSYIFRGGDTWHFGNSTPSDGMPYTGGGWLWQWVGSAGNSIYVGVDLTWYNSSVCGASWCRPFLNGDNPITNSTTLPTCTYQTSKHAGSLYTNTLIDANSTHDLTFDNFELLGVCNDTPNQPANTDLYIGYGGAQVTFLNLYLHGWSHKQFDPYNNTFCISSTGMCVNIRLFQGGRSVASGLGAGSTYKYIVVDGSDSDASAAAICYCDGYDVEYSVFHEGAQFIASQPHIVHDNLFSGIHSANQHPNLLESVSDAPGTNAWYNNVFVNVNNLPTDNEPQVGLWPAPCFGTNAPSTGCPNTYTTTYVFNSVLYNTGLNGAQGVEIFNGDQGTANQGSLVIFNNTLVNDQSSFILSCSGTGSHTTDDSNNHYITDYTSAFTTPCTGVTHYPAVPLKQSHATANGQGYTSAQAFAYSPTAGGATIGAGVNKSSYCSALTSAGLTAAGTACLSDTSYAVTENTGNHTVVMGARTPVLRPSVAAWDIGAYQYLPPTSYTFQGGVAINGGAVH